MQLGCWLKSLNANMYCTMWDPYPVLHADLAILQF